MKEKTIETHTYNVVEPMKLMIPVVDVQLIACDTFIEAVQSIAQQDELNRRTPWQSCCVATLCYLSTNVPIFLQYTLWHLGGPLSLSAMIQDSSSPRMASPPFILPSSWSYNIRDSNRWYTSSTHLQ